MIDCRFFGREGALTGFSVAGHDETGPDGVSLLCAAVSSAVYLTVNTLTDIARIPPLSLDERSGLLSVRFAEEQIRPHREILEGLRLHLSALAGEYPGKIRLHTEISLTP